MYRTQNFNPGRTFIHHSQLWNRLL